MPNQETGSEVESKQPTGSSKRKRKQSIKRNIVLEHDTTDNDTKSTKVERTYGKRIKSDKGKSVKDVDEVTSKKSDNSIEKSCFASVKTETIEKQDELSIPERGGLTEEKAKCKNPESDSSTSVCGSTKQQCQNCKFCSEHKMTKQNSDESKEKQFRIKKKFPCEICAKDGSPRVYNSIEKHKNHMATVHEIYSEEIKRFECTDCPETVWFPTKSKFTYHLGTKHPGIIKFICEVCTETFKLKANYKNHMKTHNIVVQKKFSCDVCNGTFVNKAGYEAHKKRFPGPHIKQSCSHCGFSFSREKHMKNHRCKTLLLEEAAARANNTNKLTEPANPQEEDPLKVTVTVETETTVEGTHMYIDKKITTDPTPEADLAQKKLITDSNGQANKRVVFHRIIPRRNQDQTVYRPVQMQTQTVPESVVVQELREIDFENGTFIAAEPEQQFIVRDINGHLVQGNQIVQLDINDVQPGEESQVYLADWNIVAPYLIREKSP